MAAGDRYRAWRSSVACYEVWSVASEHFELRNWGKYQHYRERRPPWIKLSIDIFDSAENPDMYALGVPARYLAVTMLCLAGKTGNRIPAHIPWLSVESKMTHAATRKAISELRAIGFVRFADDNGASTLLSEVPAHRETETEQTSLLRRLVDATKPDRPRDEVWDVLTDLFGKVVSGTMAHGKRNVAVRDLKRLEATPELILAARKKWDRVYEGATCTDAALAKHYPQLIVGVNLQPAVPCPVCEMGGGRHTADCEAVA
jgi:hypothetical protein